MYAENDSMYLKGCNVNFDIWEKCLTINIAYRTALAFQKALKPSSNMSYGATVGASAANSNLIEFKK